MFSMKPQIRIGVFTVLEIRANTKAGVQKLRNANQCLCVKIVAFDACEIEFFANVGIVMQWEGIILIQNRSEFANFR